ncbi:cytochrome c peroxidase [Undibacterium sp. TS12]|uniref:cytochrome-c peroxidase n=1 Tax=Undibacterium sp. TS12 TaxID=2908202 RepID=UPI001F4CD258|nr:cytochrome c peroxidase [Undibacterium sp. TS12]MCH8620550.1 cytochrome c family protein [Undibacterium sp. TS12]
MPAKIRSTITIVLILALSAAANVPTLAEIGAQDKLGLPAVSQADDAAKSTLGQQLFFDKKLSRDNTISCASCHQPEHAFSDARKLAQGINGQAGTRNTPSLINAVFNQSQFWDGRRSTLESQAADPFLNAREHGLPDAAALLAKLRHDPAYRLPVQKAYGIAPNALQLQHITGALASFERTLVAGNSAFDRYYYKNEKTSLTPAAQRGLQLFTGSAQCATCHKIDKNDALFTDNQFHGLGVGFKKIEARLPQLTQRLVRAQEQNNSLDQAVLSEEDIAELGRFAVTLNPADIGKFRTPSLRNVALTAPYMHDGSVATLAEAVELEIYYRSAESQKPLILTPLEKADLVEFLKALTSPTAQKSPIQNQNQ